MVAPAAATATGVLLDADGEVVATSAYLLGVVVAAAVGGRLAGLGAAVLSFLGLNFFFTEPEGTFRVGKGEDLVALVVFLIVAAIVGSLLTAVVSARIRSERREQETAMTSFVGTQLLAGFPLEVVLRQFAAALTASLGLAACEIDATVGDRRVDVAATGTGELGERLASPLVVGDRTFGALTVVRRSDARAFGDHELRLVRAAADQVSIALERADLGRQIQSVRGEREAMGQRAALFSSVTHDLRTPLASIKASVTSLLDASAVLDDAARRDLLRTVLEETDRLDRLVGNLLDLARVRSGGLEPATEPTSVEEVLDSVLHRLREPLAPFRVRTVIRPELPDVAADPVQLDQALTNVLENAIRFSPRGGEIVVTAARWRDLVRVSVGDQGPGVPVADRERVFEAFFRSDAGTGRAGSGLGLAIVRAIATAHGGRATMEASPTGGAVVAIELPVARISEPVG